MKACSEKEHLRIKEKFNDSGDFVEKVKDISNIFALLGEPNRMKILLALMEGELCVYHICEITGGKQSATSQHLRKLKDNKLVKCRKEANQVLYSIADDHVKSIISLALEHKNCKF